MIGLEHYLTVAAAIFVFGVFGLFRFRKNVIILSPARDGSSQNPRVIKQTQVH